MKRTGILTHYYKSKNIGGLLQSYALAEFLINNAFNTEQICFEHNFFDEKAQKLFNELYPRACGIKKIISGTLNLIRNGYLSLRKN